MSKESHLRAPSLLYAAHVATTGITDYLGREALVRWSKTSKNHDRGLSEKLAHSCKGLDGFAGAYNEENTVNADGLLVINKDWKWDDTWKWNDKIRRVVLLPGVKTVGKKAFWHCDRIRRVRLPESLESIGNQAFQNCEVLTSIAIPNSVNVIGAMAFACCWRLTSVTFPEVLDSIECCAFSGCTGLMSVTFPKCLKTIGYRAFSACKRLKSLELPRTFEYINLQTFSGCKCLESVMYIDDDICSVMKGEIDDKRLQCLQSMDLCLVKSDNPRDLSPTRGLCHIQALSPHPRSKGVFRWRRLVLKRVSSIKKN